MAISDKDRKLLWGRSHNRCAYCQQLLSVEARTDDRAAIVGDEAHIISGAPNGPRGTESICVGIDSYENLVLLCRTHHKMIDDQPHEFTVDRLIEMKKHHEDVTEARFSSERKSMSPLPIRVKQDPLAPKIALTWMQTGSDIWSVIADAQSWKFFPLDENDSSEIQQDAADDFLSLAQDYGNVSFEIALEGLSAIRSAKRQFGEHLNILQQLGLVVFGRRVRLVVTGGVTPDEYWMQGELIVLRLDHAMPMTEEGESEPAGT
jgi:hypothetical protein